MVKEYSIKSHIRLTGQGNKVIKLIERFLNVFAKGFANNTL